MNTSPWTIKSVPVAVREKAIRYARQDGVTMAEWLGRAVEAQAAIQDGVKVIPPGSPVDKSGRPVDRATLAAATEALQAMAAAKAAGLLVPKRAREQATAALFEGLRSLRGFPPIPDRERKPLTLNGSRVGVELNGEGLVHE